MGPRSAASPAPPFAVLLPPRLPPSALPPLRRSSLLPPRFPPLPLSRLSAFPPPRPLRPSPFSRRFAAPRCFLRTSLRSLSRASPSSSPLSVAPNYIVRDTKVSKLFYIASDTTNFFTLFSKNGPPRISDGQGLILCLGPCPHFCPPRGSRGQGPPCEIRPCPIARRLRRNSCPNRRLRPTFWDTASTIRFPHPAPMRRIPPPPPPPFHPPQHPTPHPRDKDVA